MSLLTIRPGETRVGRDEVEQYMVRGHWGYVLDYRREHGGRDPDPKMLDELVRKAEHRKLNPVARLLKGIIDFFT